jgi:hypothetical protein
MDGPARPWPARVAALIAKAFIIAKSICAARERERRKCRPFVARIPPHKRCQHEGEEKRPAKHSFDTLGAPN